jgi:hypothetical protein
MSGKLNDSENKYKELLDIQRQIMLREQQLEDMNRILLLKEEYERKWGKFP